MKKKTLTIAIALVLVVALAVGATWAYLTKTSNVVTNTFTAGTVLGDDSTFELKEHDVQQKANGTYSLTDAYAQKDGAYCGVEYKDVVPGVNLPKDPAVTVEKLKTQAYLYIVVDKQLAAGMTADVDSNNWKQISDDGQKVLYVYAKNGGVIDANAAASTIYVLAGSGTGDTANGQVVVADTYTGEGVANQHLTVTAYLVQTAGANDYLQAWNNTGFGTGIDAETPSLPTAPEEP